MPPFQTHMSSDFRVMPPCKVFGLKNQFILYESVHHKCILRIRWNKLIPRIITLLLVISL
jgi:hypothetical protein